MLDYERDTTVIDVDDWQDQPAVSRRRTGEVAVHVYLNGTWHRRSPGLGATACGEPIHSQFAPLRPEQHIHPLSRDCGCFTAFELAKADEREEGETP